MKKFIATLALLLMVPGFASAQKSEDPHYRGEGYFFFGVGPGIIACTGVFTCGPTTRQVVKHVGFGGQGFLHKGLGLGMELGYARWWADGEEAGIGSVNLSYHLRRTAAHTRVEPFVLWGYTLMFRRSEFHNVTNFGGGVNLWMAKHAALRFEVRNYTPVNIPRGYQNFVEFRVGLTFR